MGLLSKADRDEIRRQVVLDYPRRGYQGSYDEWRSYVRQIAHVEIVEQEKRAADDDLRRE